MNILLFIKQFDDINTYYKQHSLVEVFLQVSKCECVRDVYNKIDTNVTSPKIKLNSRLFLEILDYFQHTPFGKILSF